jgi:hypothetical protein
MEPAMYCRNALLALSLLLPWTSLVAVDSFAAEYVWGEAESATDKVEHSNDWYDPVDRKTSLSAGDWWHSFDEPWMKSGYVVCPFRIPAAGKYRLWIRLNLSSTGYRYAVDDAQLSELPVKQWREEDKEHRETIEHERRVFDEVYVSHDGSNRHKLAWIKCEQLELARGDHRLHIAVKPGADNKGFAAVDCFVLAAEGFKFRPRMFYKPDQRVETAPELDPVRAWAFPSTRDTFGPSPIDLRHLNEAVAGEHGFIRLSDDGERLVRGDGRPIRFWSGSLERASGASFVVANEPGDQPSLAIARADVWPEVACAAGLNTQKYDDYASLGRQRVGRDARPARVRFRKDHAATAGAEGFREAPTGRNEVRLSADSI